MSELLMFNPNTLAQHFLSAHNTHEIEKMKEQGWVTNPRLVNMYHPEFKKYVMVPVQDQKIWEVKGYFADPTVIYHPTEATRMVSAVEAKKAYNHGWYASPAHFPGNSEGKIKTPNVMKEAV